MPSASAGSAAAGAALVAAVAAAATTSGRWLRGFDYARVAPHWQPRGGAFGIWGVLFLLALLAGADVAGDSVLPRGGGGGGGGSATDSDVVLARRGAAVWLALAYALSAAWAPTFATGRRFGSAAAVLVAAWGAAVAAARLGRRAATLAAAEGAAAAAAGGRWAAPALLEVAAALLAGWLGVAASLGVAIAARASPSASAAPASAAPASTAPASSAPASAAPASASPASASPASPPRDDEWLAHAGALVLATTAVASAQPLLLLPVMWALAWWPSAVPDEVAATSLASSPGARAARAVGVAAAAWAAWAR